MVSYSGELQRSGPTIILRSERSTELYDLAAAQFPEIEPRRAHFVFPKTFSDKHWCPSFCVLLFILLWQTENVELRLGRPRSLFRMVDGFGATVERYSGNAT